MRHRAQLRLLASDRRRVDRGRALRAVDMADHAAEGGGDRLARMQKRMADLITLLEPIGATRHDAGDGGADITQMAAAGVPALGLATPRRSSPR
jgi:hypothetical protein